MMKYKSLILFYVIVFCLFYLLSHFTPVDFGDDLCYKLVFGGAKQPIQSFADLLTSVHNHYFVQHGRVPFVFFCQLFDGILGKVLFDIVNSMVFCLTLYLALTYAHQNRSLFAAVMLLCIVFVFMPAFEETHLWLVGSTDYLWAVTFIIAFLMLFRKYAEKRNSWNLLWLCPFTVIVAMFHEGFSLALSFGLLVYLFYNRKNILKMMSLPMTIAFMIGTLLLVFAPGTLRRTHTENGIDMMYIVTRLVAGVYSLFLTLRVFWMAVFVMVYLYWKRRDTFKDFISNHKLELSSMLVSPAILFVDARYGGRINYSIEVLSLIVLLQLLPLLHIGKYKTKLVYASVVLTVIFYVPAVVYAHENYVNYQAVLDQLENKNEVVGVQDLSLHNYITDRYVHPIVRIGIENYYQSYSYDDPVMIGTAIIYGLSRVCLVPQDILTYIQTHDNSDNIVQRDYWPLLVKYLPDTCTVKKVKLILKPTDFTQLPLYLQKIAPRMGKYTLLEFEPRYSVIESDNKHILLIERQLPEMDSRLKDVEIYK